MLKLLYTGVSESNLIQPDATKSLGGYISSTSFFNGLESNLFASLTISQLKSKESQYRLLALKSTTGVTHIKIWIETDSTLCDFELAFVDPALDSCQKEIFESIPFGNVMPAQATFTTRTSSSPDLGSFTQPKTIGIWVKLKIKDGVYNSILNNYDCENIDEILEEQKQLINFTIKVDYTDPIQG